MAVQAIDLVFKGIYKVFRQGELQRNRCIISEDPDSGIQYYCLIRKQGQIDGSGSKPDLVDLTMLVSNAEADGYIFELDEGDTSSGSPDDEFKNGDFVKFKLPAMYSDAVDRPAEFDDCYIGQIHNSDTAYSHAQIIYADGSFGPRIPLFNLMGKVYITKTNRPGPTSGYQITLKPASGWTGSLTDAVTSGEFIPLADGDTYNVVYDDVTYSNMEVSSMTIPMLGQDRVIHYIGNLGAVFLRSEYGLMAGYDAIKDIVETDEPFVIASVEGGNDMLGFMANPADHTFTVTSATNPSNTYSIEISEDSIDQNGTVYVMQDSKESIIETLGVEVGKVQDIIVGDDVYTGIWLVNGDSYAVLIDGYDDPYEQPVTVMLETVEESGETIDSSYVLMTSSIDEPVTVSIPVVN